MKFFWSREPEPESKNYFNIKKARIEWTLLDGSKITTSVKGYNSGLGVVTASDIVTWEITSVFREGVLRVTDNSFLSAREIKSALILSVDDHWINEKGKTLWEHPHA